MIITINGMPCSGKSSAIEYLKNKYGFSSVNTGELYRQEAEKRGMTILEFNEFNKDGGKIDELIDQKTIQIGKTRFNEELIFDSRMAWHFIPNSFKVFLVLSADEMAKRLINSKRSEGEKTGSLKEAKRSLLERYKLENERYIKLYGVDKNDKKHYDLVIDNTNLTKEETAETIYREYLKYKENKNSSQK